MGFPAFLGSAVFGFVMWTYAKAHSHMWRRMSAHYPAGRPSPPFAKKFPESIVITKRGEKGPLIFGNVAYRLYAGVAITVHHDGLSLSLVPPFNIRCPPLFLPFDQMRLEPTSWGLWPEPFAIRMRRATDVDLVIDRSVVGWIREHVDREPFGLGV